jgi:hypothetical protein
MRLIGGVRYLPPGAPDDYEPDWALAFMPDCSDRVLIELYHIKNVVPALQQAIGDTVAMSSAWRSVATEVHLEAGDQLGDFVNGPHSVAWDFIVRDEDVVNAFASPTRYANSNILHVICPYAHYTPELRAAYEALLGAPGAGPQPGTACGSVSVDVIGALAGQWFFDPDPSTGSGELSLMNGYGNPHPIVKNPDGSLTFGNVGFSLQGFRLYPDAPTWRDPAEVTSEHCYQLATDTGTPEGWLYYVIVSNSEMKLFYSSTGTCPQTAPVSGGRSYYR